MKIQLNKRTLKAIALEYGAPVFKPGPCLGGLSSTNWLVRTNCREFVLKQCKKDKLTTLEKANEITFFLKKNKIPVVIPLKTCRGNYHVKWGNYLFVLYPKINGRILGEASLTKEALINTARLLSTLHDLEIPSYLRLKKNTLVLNFFLKKAEDCKKLILTNPLSTEIDELCLSFIDKKIDIMQKTVFRKKRAHEKMDSNDFVHGDLHSGNILFNGNDQILCLLDFEETHRGCGFQDLMEFIHSVCCCTGYREKNLRMSQILLESYLAKRFIEKDRLILNITHYMYHRASYFFFEEKLYITKNMKFLNYIRRDLLKLSYITLHAEQLIEQLSYSNFNKNVQ